MDCVDLTGLAHRVAERVRSECGLPPDEAAVDSGFIPLGKPPIALTWYLDYRGDGLAVLGVLDGVLNTNEYLGAVGPVRVGRCEQQYRWVGTVSTDLMVCKVFVYRDLDGEVGA